MKLLCLTSKPAQVLTGQGLATFTLTDCVQSLLGETIEVLAPHHLAALQQQVAADAAGPAAARGAALESSRAAALRLARYARRRVAAVSSLAERLATLPECFEMARATGLTCGQVMYNAQVGAGQSGSQSTRGCKLDPSHNLTNTRRPDDSNVEPAAPRRAPQGVRRGGSRQALCYGCLLRKVRSRGVLQTQTPSAPPSQTTRPAT
jgi:hypothetical protein